MPKTVTLFYRQSRPNANFSIEASFDQMVESFPADTGFCLKKAFAPVYSNGIFPRLQLIRWAARHAGDINHITGDIHFIALGLPRHNTVLTIHDCGFMTHPHPVMRFMLWLLWLKLPVWWCRRITALSEATKADIVRHTGCSPEKIVVIPTVIKSLFHRTDKVFDQQNPTVLHIGTAPNKNLLRHIQALSGLHCVLHIIGLIHPHQTIALAQHRINYRNSVNLTDEAVMAAYADADLLLFASTLEGFGMPILEAQTVGRPVITSNTSSMPWVAGPGACLVDPNDVASIRAGLIRVITVAKYRNDLVAEGHRNVERFRPEGVAGAYAELYHALG
jgi:glycosyltransferase involved in cell wall biosynthesis